MPLAFAVFLLGLFIWQKIRTGEPWTRGDTVKFFAVLATAMLIKGPIVYAFLLPGLVAFIWLKHSNAWSGWWPWIASLAVFAAWVGGGIWLVPGFYEQVVLREFAGRFGETVHRPQPFYFYIPHLLHKFAPWSILLIAFAIVLRRGRSAPELVWLICWSLGGLLVMSLIPSKRVDRIFPVIPPLCLLLAAQFSRLTTDARRWSSVALLVACLFTSAYAAQRVITSYQNGEAALVEFGAAVRREAAQNHWRYEVVGGPEEGLLLYLRKTRFVKPDEAIARWSGGELDAVVVPADNVPAFPGATPAGIEAAVTINQQPRRYLLLRRG
jgi:4-amino-4-deoxy-L-arabinose transferase-like glycosyltransferase